jgi:hypothetical protein
MNTLIRILLRRAYIQLGGKRVRQSPNDSEEPTIYREVIQSKGQFLKENNSVELFKNLVAYSDIGCIFGLPFSNDSEGSEG